MHQRCFTILLHEFSSLFFAKIINFSVMVISAPTCTGISASKLAKLYKEYREYESDLKRKYPRKQVVPLTECLTNVQRKCVIDFCFNEDQDKNDVCDKDLEMFIIESAKRYAANDHDEILYVMEKALKMDITIENAEERVLEYLLKYTELETEHEFTEYLSKHPQVRNEILVCGIRPRELGQIISWDQKVNERSITNLSVFAKLLIAKAALFESDASGVESTERKGILKKDARSMVHPSRLKNIPRESDDDAENDRSRSNRVRDGDSVETGLSSLPPPKRLKSKRYESSDVNGYSDTDREEGLTDRESDLRQSSARRMDTSPKRTERRACSSPRRTEPRASRGSERRSSPSPKRNERRVSPKRDNRSRDHSRRASKTRSNSSSRQNNDRGRTPLKNKTNDRGRSSSTRRTEHKPPKVEVRGDTPEKRRSSTNTSKELKLDPRAGGRPFSKSKRPVTSTSPPRGRTMDTRNDKRRNETSTSRGRTPSRDTKVLVVLYIKVLMYDCRSMEEAILVVYPSPSNAVVERMKLQANENHLRLEVQHHFVDRVLRKDLLAPIHSIKRVKWSENRFQVDRNRTPKHR